MLKLQGIPLVLFDNTSIFFIREYYMCIYIMGMLTSIFQKTEGYSGSDIKLVCKEAAMRPVRKIFDALENQTEG